MCKLFDSKVLPVLCYGAEVWGMVKSEEIEKVYIVPICTTIEAPTAAVMAELG